jgi:hypothetical protein
MGYYKSAVLWALAYCSIRAAHGLWTGNDPLWSDGQGILAGTISMLLLALVVGTGFNVWAQFRR